jgi:hypothetical protein
MQKVAYPENLEDSFISECIHSNEFIQGKVHSFTGYSKKKSGGDKLSLCLCEQEDTTNIVHGQESIII